MATAACGGASSAARPAGRPIGPLGAKYSGQVVFHSKPIASQSANDSSIIHRYTLGEPLFARFWASNSPNNVRGENCGASVKVEAKVNGMRVLLWNDDQFAAEDYDTLVTASLTDNDETPLTAPWTGSEKTQTQRNFQYAIVPALHDGTNQLEVRAYGGCEADKRDTTLARGTLEIDAPPGSIDAALSTIADYPRSKLAGQDEINAEVATQVQDQWHDREVVGAALASDDWEPIREEATGRLVAKQTYVEVFYHMKDEANPRVCEVQTYTVERDVAGGSLRVGHADAARYYPCARAPKAPAN
jgi:hypothetical protein